MTYILNVKNFEGNRFVADTVFIILIILFYFLVKLYLQLKQITLFLGLALEIFHHVYIQSDWILNTFR